jgi:hypothetical protein
VCPSLGVGWIRNLAIRNFASKITFVFRQIWKIFTFDFWPYAFYEISRNFSAEFREIIDTKFREINFNFAENFVFREIETSPCVSTLVTCVKYEVCVWDRYMRQNLSYVSDGEVCVVGRGYGAWLAAGLLAQHKELDIKCGILLNPLARWQDTGQNLSTV